MMLDTPLKIAALLGVLILLRFSLEAFRKFPNRAFVVELLNSALIAFALVFLLIRPFLLQAFFIPSGSMEPTLHGPDPYVGRAGDRILVNKFIYRLGSPRRGDIIVFQAPPQAFFNDEAYLNGIQNGTKDYIKRVIGLSGDAIQIKAGEGVYRNGRLLNEPYISEIPNYDWPTDSLGCPRESPYIVPENHLFVLGDNRNSSNDSHLWRDPLTRASMPALPMENVLGRSLIIFWPLDRVATLTK